MKNYDTISTSILSTLGISVSLQDLQNILSIILLIVSILNILIIYIGKLIVKIKKANEDGTISNDEIEDITNTASEGTQKIIEKIEESEDKSNDNN